MTRLTRYFWFALASLALTGLTPSPTQASCGDYVHIGSPQANEASQAAKQTSSPMPVPFHPGRKPCSGPGCSEGRPPLLPPPPATPSAEEEQCGHNALGNRDAEQGSGFLPHLLTAARPVRFVPSVYHPPR